MDITGIRLISAAILLAATALCGIVPLAIFRSCRSRNKSSPNSFVVSGLSASHFKKKEKRIISYDAIMKLLMFFGGGILLATCFVHMIPEVRENFDNYFAHHHRHGDHGHHDHGLSKESSDAHHHHHSSEVAVTNGTTRERITPGSSSNDRHNHGHDHHDHDHDHHSHRHDHGHDHDSSGSSNEGESEEDHDHSHDQSHPHHHHSHSSDSSHSQPEALTSSLEASDHDDHPEKHSHHGHSHNHGIPYVELSICAGFFFIFLLEEVIHTFIGHSHEGESDAESLSINTSPCGTCSPDPACRKDSSSPSVEDAACIASSVQGGYVNYAIDLKSETQVNMVRSDESDKSIDTNVTNTGQVGHEKIFHTNSFDELVLPSPLFNKCHSDNKNLKPASVRFIQGVVVIVAFSAHSIFDGVAIGLQEEPSRLWTMFFAICSHKLVVALAVGMDLLERTQSLVMASGLMIIFSLMSPLGILIVIFTESKVSGSDSPVIILLSAVATGTILYIVFFEILVRQRSTDPCKLFGLLLYVSMLLGFILMFLMTTYIVH